MRTVTVNIAGKGPVWMLKLAILGWSLHRKNREMCSYHFPERENMGICYNTRKIFETHTISYPVYTKGCFVLHISKKKKKVPHELNLQMIVIFTIFTSILLFFLFYYKYQPNLSRRV